MIVCSRVITCSFEFSCSLTLGFDEFCFTFRVECFSDEHVAVDRGLSEVMLKLEDCVKYAWGVILKPEQLIWRYIVV